MWHTSILKRVEGTQRLAVGRSVVRRSSRRLGNDRFSLGQYLSHRPPGGQLVKVFGGNDVSCQFFIVTRQLHLKGNRSDTQLLERLKLRLMKAG